MYRNKGTGTKESEKAIGTQEPEERNQIKGTRTKEPEQKNRNKGTRTKEPENQGSRLKSYEPLAAIFVFFRISEFDLV